MPNGTNCGNAAQTATLKASGFNPTAIFFFLGRFSPEKNCDFLIEAFEKLERPMKLVLAGGSSHTDDYAIDCATPQRAKTGPGLGFRRRAGRIAHQCHAVRSAVRPGRLSLALLDAMGAGVCVLASDIPKTSSRRASGLYFPAGEVTDLQRILTLLISDSVLREIGRRAQERIRRGVFMGKCRSR